MVQSSAVRVLGWRALCLVSGLAGCVGVANSGSSASGPSGGATNGPTGASGPGSPAPATNVGTGGGQDFAAFRLALDQMRIPSPDTLDAAGFFAEHFTSLPAPTCGKTLCLHGLLSISPDDVHGGEWTLLQMGMNTAIDPAKVQKPPLDLAVVLDHSGSMADAGKMEYAKQGVQLLIDGLGEADTLTFVVFDSTATTLFGPARVTDKAALKTIVGRVQPGSGTNIYDGLQTAYKAALSAGDETQDRRVIFLTDGLANQGIADAASIEAMSASYNAQYVGLTTIGLGSDADLTLLRALSERAGGNFYFAESPSAVTEVFSQELAFFVAPVAYDLQINVTQLPAYGIGQVYGTKLWSVTELGGRLQLPSAFLVSRTSPDPDPTTGGRRGGGSAIIADLGPTDAVPHTGPCEVATLALSYRLPGSTTVETDQTTVSYDTGAVSGTGYYYSSRDIEKNTIILGLFVALREATARAQTDPGAAHDLLFAYQPKLQARIAGWADQDLLDDLTIVQQYVDLLAAKSASH
jgi:Ca-activated chloride channel family protein